MLQLEERKSKGEGIRTIMGGPDQTDDEIKYSIVLTEIAEAHGLESPTAVAIAYLMQKAPYVFPLVGGRKVEVSSFYGLCHVRAILTAMSCSLLSILNKTSKRSLSSLLLRI
jgi:predicted oxidoreductase